MVGSWPDQERLWVFLVAYDNLYPQLCNYAETIVHDEDIGASIVVNKLIEYRKTELFTQSIDVVRRTLFKAVRNACIDYLRMVKRQQEGLARMPSGASDLNNEEVSPDDAMIRAEVLGQFHAIVDQLPEEIRTVIREHYWNNKTIKQLAQEYNIPEPTIYGRKTKGLGMLKDKLKQLGLSAKGAFDHFFRK
jgi:RNA polymerase sigma factor (sigma-70 family)